jgi:hypothetical protein
MCGGDQRGGTMTDGPAGDSQARVWWVMIAVGALVFLSAAGVLVTQLWIR